MAQNYDGLYELRIPYVTTPASEDPMEHVFTIDVLLTEDPMVGDSFDTIEAEPRSGIPIMLNVAVDALVDLMIEFFPTTTGILRAELWKYNPEPSQDATFISVYVLGATGANTTPSQSAGQNTLTLRTVGGGIMRVQFMETSFMNNLKDPFPFSNEQAANLASYLTGISSPFVGRDNTPPIAANYFSQTQNEKLYRKRWRAN